MTIGQRAVQLIRERVNKNGTTFKHECELITTTDTNVLVWSKGYVNPRAVILAEMCKQGYDVIYILTGERKDNG